MLERIICWLYGHAMGAWTQHTVTRMRACLRCGKIQTEIVSQDHLRPSDFEHVRTGPKRT